MIRPITENVPCGRSNRNPSNIINILVFQKVRMQCNIRGAESQCSAETASNSLHSVHFRCLTSDYKKVTIPLTIPNRNRKLQKALKIITKNNYLIVTHRISFCGRLVCHAAQLR